MTENRKKLLKKCLYISTIILALIWVILFFYGVFFEVKITNKIEEKLAQTYNVDITEPSVIHKDESNEAINKTEEAEIAKSLSDLMQKAKNPEEHREKAKISIIVTNLGTNKALTQQALALPRTITLGFSPYTTSLKEYYQQAVKSGFDVFIYMPFEPADYPMSDPGPYGIFDENPVEKNLSIIKNMLSSFSGAKGIYANYREGLSSNEKAFSPIIDLMNQKNMLILLGRDYTHDQSKYLQNHKNIISGDVIIDMIPDQDAIKHSLNNLLSLAKSKKSAVGYINTYPITLKILSEWLGNLKDPDIEIVPLSLLAGN